MAYKLYVLRPFKSPNLRPMPMPTEEELVFRAIVRTTQKSRRKTRNGDYFHSASIQLHQTASMYEYDGDRHSIMGGTGPDQSGSWVGMEPSSRMKLDLTTISRSPMRRPCRRLRTTPSTHSTRRICKRRTTLDHVGSTTFTLTR